MYFIYCFNIQYYKTKLLFIDINNILLKYIFINNK